MGLFKEGEGKDPWNLNAGNTGDRMRGHVGVCMVLCTRLLFSTKDLVCENICVLLPYVIVVVEVEAARLRWGAHTELCLRTRLVPYSPYSFQTVGVAVVVGVAEVEAAVGVAVGVVVVV